MAWDISSVNLGSVKSILLVADFVNCQYVWCWQPFPLLSQRCGSIFGWSLNWYIQASTWLYRCPSQVPTGALHTNVGSNGRLYVSWCQQPLSISSMASKSKQRSATMQIQEALRLRDEYHTWHTPGRRLEDKHPPLYLSVRCLCANCHCLSMIFASTSSSWFYMTQTSQDRKERSASKYITLARGISQSFTSSRVSDARSLSSDGMPFTLALTSTVRYSSMKACFTPALTYSIVVWRWFGLQTQPNGLACCLLSYTLGTTRWKDTTRCHGERTCAASRSPWCSIMLSSYSVYSTSDLYKLSISSFGTYT